MHRLPDDPSPECSPAGADARVLGQILAAQSMVFSLPDIARTAEFYAGVLMIVPGVAGSAVCLGDISASAGEIDTSSCPSCEGWQRRAHGVVAIPPQQRLVCGLSGRPDIRLVGVDSLLHHFGVFVLRLDSMARFASYEPFIDNLSNYVAIALENRWQQDELRRGHLDLEQKVSERTRALSDANAALEAARQAALDMMRTAVDASHRAEEANAHLRREAAERQRAETEVRQLNVELEARVADRTAQLQAAVDELEAFSYSVSHDLRAPLRHIEGFLALLQQRSAAALDERGRHYVAMVLDAAGRMEHLIEDLLSFSRMSRLELSRRPVDLGQLVREVIEELHPDADGRSIEWGLPNLPVVSGDPAMLRVVISNLLANALKFTRPRPVAKIDVGSTEHAHEVVCFVRDNGVGFSEEHANSLFGVFQRLHRAEEFEGTGIGLATVRRIIHRHGGRTWATGAVGAGATFYFSLPHSTAS